MSETTREGFEGGLDGPEVAAARAEAERAAEPTEAELYPNRADPEHWAAISICLNDLCGDEDTLENMVECLRLNWAVLTDKDATLRKANGVQLVMHEAEAQRQDEARPALDAKILELRGR